MKIKSQIFYKKIIAFIIKNYRVLTFVGIILMLPLIYMLVYYTGGIKYVFSHIMYIPIILAGISFGPTTGVFIGVIAGLLLGPLMPVDTITNEPQLFINWIFRVALFMFLGLISGFAANKLTKNAVEIKKLLSINQETQIPNTNYLLHHADQIHHKSQTIMTLLILNYINIINVLGTDLYYRLMKDIYDELMKALPKKSMVIQSDSNKLWIIKSFEDLEQDSRMVMAIVQRPREIDKIPLYLDYAIGTSVIYNYHKCPKLTCFKDSDASARLAAVKNLPFVIYDVNAMKNRNEYELLAGFSHALEGDETYMLYQPKVDLKTMKPVGLEALIRWEHPLKGTIMPDTFIPLVEHTRLIHYLTDWVLRKALLEIIEFQNQGITVEISINVSVKNLSDTLFFDRFIAIIEELNVSKHQIEIEITESVFMANPEETMVSLNKFATAGIRIAIDDFGKGYSSLAYLSQFAINVIKIDKFFMSHILDNASSQHIVKATIDLAKKLGYVVLAEGVEDEAVVNMLKDYGCDLAQGYYFAKPMDKDAIIEWYKTNLKV